MSKFCFKSLLSLGGSTGRRLVIRLDYYTSQHTKYVEGYIVFVFPSVHPSFRPCKRPVLTFYVKVLREVFLIHQEMMLAGGIRAPLGTCSSFNVAAEK